MLLETFDRTARPLSPDERAEASKVGVYRIDAHGEDAHGWPGSYLALVTIGLTEDEVRRDVEHLGDRRRPEWEDFRMNGPWSLLALYDWELVDATAVRALLARVRARERFTPAAAPLTPEERARAEQLDIYYVWYEDKFHYGGDRDSYAVSVCLTREEAEAEAARRGGPAEPMGSGYEVVGPSRLIEAHFVHTARGTDMVREILRRAKAGTRGPVHLPVEMWLA